MSCLSSLNMFLCQYVSPLDCLGLAWGICSSSTCLSPVGILTCVSQPWPDLLMRYEAGCRQHPNINETCSILKPLQETVCIYWKWEDSLVSQSTPFYEGEIRRQAVAHHDSPETVGQENVSHLNASPRSLLYCVVWHKHLVINSFKSWSVQPHVYRCLSLFMALCNHLVTWVPLPCSELNHNCHCV